MVRVKTKLSLGLGFLFAVIVLLTVAGLYALNRLSADAQAVLQDNYITLQFVDNMRKSLDTYRTDLSNGQSLAAAKQGFMQTFETDLTKQEGNITEMGEKEATQALRNQFELLKKDAELSNDREMLIRDLLHQISDVNMFAIVRKNEAARDTAERANFLLGIIAVLCFLISFVFIVNFPGYIADPIRQLTESIRQIADKNYSERLFFKSRDEFGELATAFNDMASRLDAYEHSSLAELLFEKKRIETLLDNMTDAVLVLDEKNKVLFVNPVACQLMAVKKTDLLGKYAPDAALHNDLLRSLLQTTTTDALKIYYNEKESYFQKETIAVRVERPNFPADAGAVILLKNITAFKELDQAKTNFIATISHELKTPISSIKMSLSLLEDKRVGALNEEQQKLLAHIRGDSQRLLNITGELLDLAQVETGNIRLNMLPGNPEIILQYALETVQIQAEQKKIRLETHKDDELPLVKIDTDKTTWVLVNLLTNAIHYSPEGSAVVIDVHKESDALLFSVRDFGKGIEERFRSRVFDRYFQVPGSPQSGTGLGLAICKEFIEAQGGDIGLESEVGAGSRFYFRLSLLTSI
ncbi:MAG: HAMP domain-containing protein [Saprospiraceae bacterium]|nr:HAMP domain-containing protein [Saprospiraceae bacterium]